MKTEPIDMSPRKIRIWHAFNVPGRNMLRLLFPGYSATQRTDNLTNLYREEPDAAFSAAALALHFLRAGAQMGPARLRDMGKMGKALDKGEHAFDVWSFGAVLRDISRFLKFRFRLKGLSGTEIAPPRAILEGLRTGDLRQCLKMEWPPTGQEFTHTAYIVNYVITELDGLSKGTVTSTEDFDIHIHRLRDILRSVGRAWHGDVEEYDRQMDRLFELPVKYG